MTQLHPITKLIGNEKRFCNWGAPDGVVKVIHVGTGYGCGVTRIFYDKGDA